MPKTISLFNEVCLSSLWTDLGWMRPICDDNNLIRLEWNQSGWHEPDRPNHVSRETKSQLQAFFDGYLKHFDLPLAPYGKDSNGRYWLETMAKIPYGTVISYAEFARRVGKPKAARAAGSVCASNPIPIIYPCHRVIRKNGQMGYYGGGGHHHPAHPDNLARKAALIKLERV